jgi:hypothetical protein
MTTDDTARRLFDVSSSRNDGLPSVVRSAATTSLKLQPLETQTTMAPDHSSAEAEQALAARQVLVSSGKQLKDLADIVSGRIPAAGTEFESYTVPELRFAFEKQLATHYAIQAQVSGMTAEAGRAW